MTVVTDALREMVAAYAPRELPPLSEGLMKCMELPPDLPLTLSIAEVVQATGVSAHTLRYYERIGLVAVDRDVSGHRSYDRDSLAAIVFVTRLRASDMPIRTITRYIDLVKQGPGTERERLELLQRHRETIVRRLSEMQAALAIIDYKIATYGGACGPH